MLKERFKSQRGAVVFFMILNWNLPKIFIRDTRKALYEKEYEKDRSNMDVIKEGEIGVK